LDKLIENLCGIVGREAVLADPGELLVYECDGLPQHKYLPRAVVFPSSTEETSAVMRVLARERIPFTPRGAGTGLSGGALALERGVVVEMARMRKVLSIDAENRIARVQTGVVNAHVSLAVAHLGLHYVPDPSSQGTCTIGGNIAESAGGIHCLKYGTTTDHVLGVRAVLAGGEVVDLGDGADNNGYDLLGVFVGSEGTFGIATEATLRLVPVPPAVRTLLAEFAEVDAASHAVSAIIAAGVMPAALEMMDREIIRAVEASIFAAGLPLDIGAALLIELDGLEAGIDAEAERVKSICLNYGARECRLARDEPERKKLWAARKGAFGAVGRIAPDSMIQDAVVPRSRLPEVMADAYRISAKFNLRLANVFHAGDGNLHPFICFDSRSADEVLRVKEAGRELMETCVRAGGTITGEHGVGLDKRDFLPLIFSEDDMDAMLRVRKAFDPEGLCNPGKIIPMLRGCGEARAVSTTGAVATGLPNAHPQDRGAASLNLKGDVTERQSLSALEGGQAAHSRRPSDPEDAAKRLGAIVGDKNVDVPDLRVTASPRLSLPAFPHLPVLVSPASIEETCEVMKQASSEGWNVVPSGAGMWLDVGNPLRRIDLLVSTARLNRILDHEPLDLVASTEVGVKLDAFNQKLNQGGQWLPLDPPDDGRATIGGVVATGASGAQRCGYGQPRSFVIGMRVVLADGRTVKAGGRVVKNVAGYDLCKLFTGSFGTLGIICEVTFKLRPLPAKQVTMIAAGGLASLLEAARNVYHAGLFPAGLELVSGTMANEFGGASTHKAQLLVRFAGIEKTVDYQVEKAEALVKSSGATRIEINENDRALWRRLQELSLGRSGGLTIRINVKPSQMKEALNLIDATNDDSHHWHAGVGDGRLRVIDDAGSSPDESIRNLTTLRQAVEMLGGLLVIENMPAEIRNRIDSWGHNRAADLMRGVKQQLDPGMLFSPGRFGNETVNSASA
jgi:glycolate oxidase subunit GlcD